ncbi:glycosyltransferase [Paludibacter sp. 221]|uniref:glycosyltransferase n=1 Tax=Paludibacter sp. 221 TaxID=2302939 RepID=UPI0013CF66D1|nr:glycosyltransferase [Paludibacter sp. 221]NDV46958.1 glycosyltransferase [Paludibacter sp. 221]
MDILGFYFSWAELVTLAIMLLMFVYQTCFYFRYLSGIIRQSKKIKKNKIEFSTAQPPVSVIIAAKNEEKNLQEFLPKILEQDYPEFEVIVIDDASADDTSIILEQFKDKYPHLRTTFVPVGAKNLSSKKLAVTLGIKAAKHDILLFTDADCSPESNQWISHMVRNFTPETDFVLGYGPYYKEKGLLNKLITYDTLFVAMQYMGMALDGKPYMGVGRNLAYRKDTFFNLKGFSSHLNLLSGDDDLLVNKGCSDKNTRIEISPESIMWSDPKKTFRNWYYQKTRHLSSSVKYKASTKKQLGIEPVSRGLFYLAFLLITLFGNIVTIIAGGILLLVRLITQMCVINRTSKLFHGDKYYLSILFLDIFLPLFTLFVMLTGKTKKDKIRWK